MQVDELLKPFPIKEFHPFPRALMGPGAHEMIGPEALKLGFKKTLVMTSGLRGSDIVNKIVESLKYHGLDVVVYDQVESNPKDYNVMDAVGLYTENGCDSFVSIGGGSSHDACKGARVAVAHDGRNVNEFEGFNKSENPKNPPHIAVSTTAGTGSETSPPRRPERHGPRSRPRAWPRTQRCPLRRRHPRRRRSGWPSGACGEGPGGPARRGRRRKSAAIGPAGRRGRNRPKVHAVTSGQGSQSFKPGRKRAP